MKGKLLILTVIVITCSLLFTSTLSIAKNTISNEDYVYYTIECVSSIDQNTDKELKEASDYIEHYTISFYSEDNPQKEDSIKKAKVHGIAKFKKDQSIKFKLKDVYQDSIADEDATISLPLFPTEKNYDDYISGSNFSIVSISINNFYSAKDEKSGIHKRIMKKDIEKYKQSRVNNFKPILKPCAFSGVVEQGSQNFSNMYSVMYVYEEYNATGTQKRNKYEAWHNKNTIPNQLEPILGNNPIYVNTRTRDSNPDIISLAWNVGGAIPSNDSSIVLSGRYDINCPVDGCCTVVETISKSSSTVSQHSSLFNGNSIGFNIPDRLTGIPNPGNHYGRTDSIYPTGYYISAITGWYNKGAYFGAKGTVRSEYFHTYQNFSISVSAGIAAPPANFGFSVTPSSYDASEKTWVYAVVSPN